MKNINFTKMVASGNDFVLIDGRHHVTTSPRHHNLAKKICDRKFGVGADGLLVLEKSRAADIKMRVFNADGSEAQMCGNGARCVALYLSRKSQVTSHKFKIETGAGIIQAEVSGDNIRIKLTDPRDIRLDIPIKINNRRLKVNFINTGVPHTVVFAAGLDKIDIVNLGRQIRRHQRFKPAGTNADFVEVISDDTIKIRTYERGVEDETLACGTGSVASALLYAIRYTLSANSIIKVHTQSGEILKVYFTKIANNFRDVWLQGRAKIVFKGEFLP
ncbi:MAG: diaminopimelate epimerase [Candidatus Omnitrophica bacterium]|nr:diaminopimelate epimerase [Candidatus Omnitrophota bacterium]